MYPLKAFQFEEQKYKPTFLLLEQVFCDVRKNVSSIV